MPSARRWKTFGFLITITVFTIIYLTSDSRRAASQDFYSTTVNALNAKTEKGARELEESRLATKKGARPEAAGPAKPVGQQAQAPIKVEIPSPEDEAKDGNQANGKSAAKDEVKEKGVGGRPKMRGGEKWDMASGKEAAMQVDKDKESKEEEREETKEEHEVEVELNTILKKGPIIVFSKSYCPFSLKAKRILLEKYKIVPAPYIVELDQHPLGGALQDALAKSTGRRTVPNVLINGKSIGGGDDVEALDVGGTLIDKVRTMGGKRIMEAKLAA